MSRARRTRGRPMELGDILDALDIAAPAGVERPPVPSRLWERAVGSRIAEKSRPWRLERGILHVRVAHSVWANELALLSEEILAQLAEAGVAAQALRFSVGRIEKDGPRARPARKAPRPAELPAELARQIAAIRDPALREALAAAAASTLGAQRPR